MKRHLQDLDGTRLVFSLAHHRADHHQVSSRAWGKASLFLPPPLPTTWSGLPWLQGSPNTLQLAKEAGTCLWRHLCLERPTQLSLRRAASKATDRCAQPGSVLGLGSLHSVCLLQNRKYRNWKCTPQIGIFRLVVISAKNPGVIMGLTFYKGAKNKYFLRN